MAYSDLIKQVNDVWNKSPNINTSCKPESVYMTNRYVSTNKAGFAAAYDCNSIIGIPDWAVLPFLKYTLPLSPDAHTGYPKKLGVKKLTPKNQKGLVKICKHFNISEMHGRQVMELLVLQNKKFW